MSNSGQPLVETRGGSFQDGLRNGYKLLDQHPAVALQQAETLIRAAPEAPAFELAAAALRRLNRPAEAEQAELAGIRASFSIQELDAAAVAGHEARGAESRAMLSQFLRQQPGSLLAMTMAAELEIEDQHLARAEERLRAVLSRAPSYLRAVMLLAKCVSSDTRLQEAIDLCKSVLDRKPNNQVALMNLAQAFAEANQHEGAAETYRRVLDMDPDNVGVWIVYAQELRMLARREEATAAFRRAIELDPHNDAAWWSLAYYFPAQISDADIAAMEQATASPPEGSGEGAALHIALGIMAERRGDYAESFRHISEGKQLQSLAHPYDAAAESRKIDERIQTFTPERFATFADAGSSADSPIFIIGMPRSGTTLLERILSRHSQIEAGGELPIMPRLDERFRHEDGTSPPDRIAAELTRIGERYIKSSFDYRSTDKPHFIDKLNYNWSRVGLIRMILPNAKIIDLRRNALDCCWSNFKMMFAEGHIASNDQRDIARFYKDYVRLVEAIDAASPGGILKVSYEELVDDVEGQTRRILDFLGLEYELECIDFHLSTAAVATPSSEQVRRPINRDSIGSAEPYREWLGPMIDELGDLAD